MPESIESICRRVELIGELAAQAGIDIFDASHFLWIARDAHPGTWDW
jgi:hypothetical protein